MLSPKHPFYSTSDFFKEKFGDRIIKLSINAGLSCPNRDGTLSDKGCIFCSEKGSGDFAGNKLESITEQITKQKQIQAGKWSGNKYMAYFQAFTNTYASVERLRQLYDEAISDNEVVALSIATRPDCINKEIADLIKEYSSRVYTCVELGLQSSKEETVRLINRQYPDSAFSEAARLLNERGIDFITHIILCLPNETREDMLNSIGFAIENGTSGLKLQLLHILKDTPLSEYYSEKPFYIPTLEEYADLIVSLIEEIPPEIVIHRITGDGPKELLIAPKWTVNKRLVLGTIQKTFIERDTFQGKKLHK